MAAERSTGYQADALVVDLYREHYLSLLKLAYLLVGSRESAEEIVQDAFVNVLTAFRRRGLPANDAAYLRTAVLNVARSRLRRLRLAGPAAHFPFARRGPEEEATLADDHRAMLLAIRALPFRQRECVVLRFYEGLTETEIAEIAGVSVGSVRTHIHRAKVALARNLKEVPR